jgi:hypothetical protein
VTRTTRAAGPLTWTVTWRPCRETSLPRSAASSPGRSPAPMPNTTSASAEARFAGSRCAAATAASSARSAGEYGAGALAPANGVARCPGGPCVTSASRYSADRYVPRVEHARPRRPVTQNASITS